MKTSGAWWMAIVWVAAAAGCVGGEEPQAHRALLLLDQEARDAGFVVLGQEMEARALPMAVSVDEPVMLAGPDGAEPLDVAEGEIVLVRGAQGTVEHHVLGEDVDPDRLVVRAPADAVAEIADSVGAEVVERSDGTVELAAPGVLALSADAPALPEILESSVVVLAAHAPHALVRAATPRLATPAARAVASAPVAAMPAAAQFEEPVYLSVHDVDYMDLPAAVSCDDAVEGTWIARRYFPDMNDWYFFTMKIDQGRRGALQGTILAHSWRGGPSDNNSAQACAASGEEWVVGMPATGRVHDGRIEFGGTSWGVNESTCGWAPGPGQYNLDQFSGSIAPNGEATWNNDDGGRMVAEPFEFRRISCGQ